MKNNDKCGIMGTRTYLRVLEEEDLKKIFLWKNKIETCRLIKTHPLPVARYEIDEWFKNNQSDKNQILLGIHDIKSNELIGIVRLMFIDWISSVAEFGIFIGNETFTGKGMGKEVLDLILDHAFNDLNLHRIHLKVNVSNTRAINLYKSCGFVEEGLLRKHFWNNGKHEDIVIMGLLRNDYVK